MNKRGTNPDSHNTSPKNQIVTKVNRICSYNLFTYVVVHVGVNVYVVTPFKTSIDISFKTSI